MFAGAVRETVFSRPEIIRLVQDSFVPVALKAADVARPQRSEEGRLFRPLRNTQPAPQGLCVLNSDGQPLDWVLMFDDDQSVDAFLEEGLKRYAAHPDGTKEVDTRRWMRYPGKGMSAVRTAKQTVRAAAHRDGERCPGARAEAPGALRVQLYGRALGKDGRPVAGTVRQEDYSEDEFSVPAGVQRDVARAIAVADDGLVPLPRSFARLCVSHAYLGQLDVAPVDNPSGGRDELRTCRLFGRVVSSKQGVTLVRLEGDSDVESSLTTRGRNYHHVVKLKWQGYLELSGGRITKLLLSARGTEKLQWRSRAGSGVRREAVAMLPAGRPIDVDRGVRYGLLGKVPD